MSLFEFNHIKNKAFLHSLLFIIFIIVLNVLLFNKANLLYPLIMNLLSILLGLISFSLSIISYKITPNKKVLFLGTSLGAISLMNSIFFLGFVRIVDYNSLIEVLLTLKYVITFSFLSSLFAEKIYSIKTSLIFYTSIWIILFVFIFYFDSFPDCFITGEGFTKFYLYSSFLNLFLMSVGILIFKSKNRLNISPIDNVVINSIYYLTFSHILFMFTDNNILFLISNILNLFAYYIFINVIVRLSICAPHEKLLNKNKFLEAQNNCMQKKLNKSISETDKQNIEIFSSALKTSINATLILSTEGEIIFKNKAFEQLNEISDELFKKENIKLLEQFINSQVLNMHISINDFLSLKESNSFYRKDWILRDGHVLNVYISFLQSQSSSDLILVSMVDVTENYNQVNKMKSEFILTMSHELKTPINVILGSVQLMETLTKEVIAASYTTKPIKTNCYRLMKFSNNIIDSLKIESHSMKLEKTTGNIVSFVESLLEFVRPLIGLKSINLIFDTDIEEKNISFDKEKIERVVLNLLSNSIKFGKEKGEILVIIKDGGDFIKITIEDNGPGISAYMSRNVFEKFSQFHVGLKRPAEGSGIGLFIAKSFIELHGGVIYMNKVDIGASFTFTLPVEKDLDEVTQDLDLKPEINLDNVSIELSDIY